MEYYLCRALEVCRLNQTELEKLHVYEKSGSVLKKYDASKGTFGEIRSKSQRCLMPHEIQSMFNKPLAKESYLIPEDATFQSVHFNRLRNEFRANDLIPKGGDFPAHNVEAVHSFDESVIQASNALKVDLVFRGKEKKSRLSSSFDE